MNLELPFGCADSVELEEYLSRIDAALDDCFLSDLDVALERAGEAREAMADAAVAT